MNTVLKVLVAIYLALPLYALVLIWLHAPAAIEELLRGLPS